MNTNVHSSLIHNSPNQETTQMSISGWLDKLAVTWGQWNAPPSRKEQTTDTQPTETTWTDLKPRCESGQPDTRAPIRPVTVPFPWSSETAQHTAVTESDQGGGGQVGV